MVRSGAVPTCSCYPERFLVPNFFANYEPMLHPGACEAVKYLWSARNAFANYLARTYWTAKSGFQCYGLSDLLDEEDQEKIDETLKDGWLWFKRIRGGFLVNGGLDGTARELKNQHKRIEGICVNIFSKYYGQICTMPNDYGPEGSDLNNLFKAYCTTEFAEGNENITVSKEDNEAASEAPRRHPPPLAALARSR